MSKNNIPKHLFTYFIASIAILVIFLDIFNITNESIISEVIVAVLAILIFTLLRLEHKIDKLMSHEKVEGIRNFRLNRENLPSLDLIFALAKEEIIIWGSVLYTIHSRSDLILNKINQGCKVKILMMSLVDKNGNPNPILDEYQKSTKHTGFKDRVSLARQEFEKFHDSLNKYQKELFDLRYYTSLSTASFIIVDKDTKNAFIRIEPFIGSVYSYESPSFDLDSSSGEKLCKVVKRVFNEIWEDSIKYA